MQNGTLSGRGVVKDKSNFLELYLYQDGKSEASATEIPPYGKRYEFNKRTIVRHFPGSRIPYFPIPAFIRIFVVQSEMTEGYVYQQGRSIGKGITGIRQDELRKSHPDGNSQGMRVVKGRTDLLFPVQAGSFRGGGGQVCIPYPTVGEQVPVHGRFVSGVYRPICERGGENHEPSRAHAR